MFNKFLKDLKTLVFTCNPSKTDFWELLGSNKLTLISNKEADDSSTTENEAEEVKILYYHNYYKIVTHIFLIVFENEI